MVKSNQKYFNFEELGNSVHLDKILHPRYWINDHFEVFDIIFKTCEVTINSILEIQQKYTNKTYNKKQLSVEYNTSSQTISRIILFGNRIWRKLKPKINRCGYYVLDVQINQKRYCKYIHRLMLEAFVGPCPPGMVACHNDGNKLNNLISNLRWDTPRNNELDKKRHGVDNTGSRNGQTILCENDVRIIRKLVDNGMTQKEVAKLYNIGTATTSNICNKKSWVHVI